MTHPDPAPDPLTADGPAPPIVWRAVLAGPTRTITTSDGRSLAFVEAGDAAAPLVIHNHGGPSSRLEGVLLADAALRHGLRLVCVDRPGMGRSSPQAARSFAGWAADLVALADALGARTFGVTGWSEGGPWALAAAAYIDPARLIHVSNLAGGCYGAFGDDWAADHLSSADKLGGTLAVRFRPGFRLMYELLGLVATHSRSSYFGELDKAVNAYDKQVLAMPGVSEAFYAATVECFAQGAAGLTRDAECLYLKWAFDVSNITRRVHFWQGTDDGLVPEVINRTVAERTPGAVWHEVKGAGHFVAVGAADRIFAVAAEELRG